MMITLLLLIIVIILLIYLAIKFRSLETEISGLDLNCCEESPSDSGFFQELVIRFEDDKTGGYNESDFIDKARTLDPGLNNITDDDEFNVHICSCNNKVAIVSLNNSPILGHIQNSPLKGEGVEDGGANYFANITSESLVISKELVYRKNEEECKFGDEQSDWIKVIFLDSAVDDMMLTKFVQERQNNIQFDKFSLTQEDCTQESSESKLHGTAVVYCFLEQYFADYSSDNIKKGVKIIVYNVTKLIPNPDRVVVPQFRVVCALLKIIDDHPDCRYMNMSFGFDINIPMVGSLINEYLQNDCILTCSAGNRGWDISTGSRRANYPSGFSRSGTVSSLIFEVFGQMNNDQNALVKWDDGQDNSTNFTVPEIHINGLHDNAVWDSSIDSRGGTSFAAPRALAKLIT